MLDRLHSPTDLMHRPRQLNLLVRKELPQELGHLLMRRIILFQQNASLPLVDQIGHLLLNLPHRVELTPGLLGSHGEFVVQVLRQLLQETGTRSQDLGVVLLRLPLLGLGLPLFIEQVLQLQVFLQTV